MNFKLTKKKLITLIILLIIFTVLGSFLTVLSCRGDFSTCYPPELQLLLLIFLIISLPLTILIYILWSIIEKPKNNLTKR